LKSNIILTPKYLKVIGAPKANAASTTQNHVLAWDSVAKTGATDWRFSVSLNYGYISSAVWSAYTGSLLNDLYFHRLQIRI
jgi:uncharacterized protein YfaA (DUF2138 family)